MGRRRDLFPLLLFSIVLVTALIATLIITRVGDGFTLPGSAIVGMGFTSVSEVPPAFAPPFDELDGVRYMYAIAVPEGNAARVTVRVDKTSSLVEKQYIYKHGHFSRNNQFERFTFPDATVGGSNWILNTATYSGVLSGLQGEEYVIVYVCKKYKDEQDYICGPRGDPPVETKKWTIDSFLAPLPACESEPDQFCYTALTATQLAGKNMTVNNSFRCSTGKCYQCNPGFTNISTHCVAGCDAANTCPNDGALRCGADGKTIQKCRPDAGCLKWGPALSCEESGFGAGTVCDGTATCTLPTCIGSDRFCGTANANTTTATGTCLIGNCLSCKPGFVNETGMCKQQCTAQNCNGAYSCSGNTCVCNGCTINGACVGNGVVNSTNQCLSCNTSLSATAWSPRPLNTPCTGGTCNNAGVCQPTGCAGCTINGACITNLTINSTNSCLICNTTASTAAWSPRTGASCTGGGTCSSAGVCQPPGCNGCMINGACVNQGQVNISNSCMVCNTSISASAYSPKPDGSGCGIGKSCYTGTCQTTCSGCRINGACIADGATNSTNSCLICNKALNSTSWSLKPDGTSCGTNLACSSGTCACTGCMINGVCVGDGTVNSTNSCLVCNKTVSQTGWSNKPTNSACTTSNGAAGTCSGSTCTQTCDGCMIGGTCHSSGTPNPGNNCQLCNTTISTTAWSSKPNGLSCGANGATCQGGTCTTCTPNANACSGKQCGTVDNGCGTQVSCGTCGGASSCQSNQCVCNHQCDAADIGKRYCVYTQFTPSHQSYAEPPNAAVKTCGVDSYGCRVKTQTSCNSNACSDPGIAGNGNCVAPSACKYAGPAPMPSGAAADQQYCTACTSGPTLTQAKVYTNYPSNTVVNFESGGQVYGTCCQAGQCADNEGRCFNDGGFIPGNTWYLCKSQAFIVCAQGNSAFNANIGVTYGNHICPQATTNVGFVTNPATDSACGAHSQSACNANVAGLADQYYCDGTFVKCDDGKCWWDCAPG